MIVAGFGFRGSAGLESLQNALHKALPAEKPSMIATVQDKAASSVFQCLSDDLNVPIAAISPELLARQNTTTQSQKSQSARKTGSVAEAAALAAAGDGAYLIAPRHISDDKQATCALAKKVDA